MNRHEFSMLICDLLEEMDKRGYQPFIDYCKRSDEEQKRIFLMPGNKTKCDGIIRISQHQRGKAADIMFMDYKELTDAELHDRHSQFHDIWESWGGAERIDWDMGHYEGR